MIVKIGDKEPDKPLFLAPNATLIGDIRLGENVSIWYGAVLRGDINYIKIGNASNVQDNSVFHVTEKLPVIIGDYVTVGHNVTIHGCIVEDYCLIGMGAIILDNARIGKGSIVAAGSVVKENAVIPPGTLVAGVPAVVKKTLPPKSLEILKESALHYVKYTELYK